MNDQELLRRLLFKDEHALREFYVAFVPRITRYIQTKISDVHDQEDILQDTLFAFLERIRDFQGMCTMKTFLFSICQHKIVDYYRRKKIRQVIFSQSPELEELISPCLGPEEELDATLLREKCQQILQRLLPQYKQVLHARYILNMPVYQIAKQLEVTIKSVDSLLFRAKKAFIRAYGR